MAKASRNIHVIARNRKARHDYEIEDTYEAGLVLVGTEVKSLRAGNCSIQESFARPRGMELYLCDMHIAPYEHGNIMNHEPKRPRKLLLHGREIGRIISRCTQRGYTLVPLSVYFSGGFVKVQLALARRRTKGDKRRKIEQNMDRENIRRELARRGRRQPRAEKH